LYTKKYFGGSKMKNKEMMNTKIVVHFICLTFLIMLIAAAVEFIVAQTLGEMLVMEEAGGFSFGNHAIFGIIVAIIGALSPAFASYMVLKKNGEVANVREWLKNIFYFKGKMFPYIFAAFAVVLYMSVHAIFSGVEGVMPLYMLFILMPFALLAGGMEEAGWSYVLQPELNKKYGFVVSSVITGLITWAWHLPLFWIPGTSHYEVWHIGMYILCNIGFRFMYGAILRISGKAGIFISVLKHTLFNAFMMVFIILPTNWTATIIAFALMIIVSSITVLIYNKNEEAHYRKRNNQ